MLKQIKIDRLFGIYNYQIDIPESGDLLILTGPNGYGKTTILNIIDRLSSNKQLHLFESFKRQKIELILNDAVKTIRYFAGLRIVNHKL